MGIYWKKTEIGGKNEKKTVTLWRSKRRETKVEIIISDNWKLCLEIYEIVLVPEELPLGDLMVNDKDSKEKTKGKSVWKFWHEEILLYFYLFVRSQIAKKSIGIYNVFNISASMRLGWTIRKNKKYLRSVSKNKMNLLQLVIVVIYKVFCEAIREKEHGFRQIRHQKEVSSDSFNETKENQSVSWRKHLFIF